VKHLASIVVSCGFLVVMGCGSDPKPRTASDGKAADGSASSGGESAKPPLSAERARDDARSVGVSIDDAIAKACGIPTADAHFDFDSTALESVDVPALNKVATCLVSGPLKGRAVTLVGRADPRGENDYNVALGQRRADAVAHYLDVHGLPRTQRSSSSRGSMDATGSDEGGWARDRRVDLVLMR
jgi:peptidoglycan-associated lipoprotein